MGLEIFGGLEIFTNAFGALTVTNDGTKTTILGLAGDYIRIGDAGTTSNSLNSEDDLMVTGELEVDGKFFADADADIAGIELASAGPTIHRVATIAGYQASGLALYGNNEAHNATAVVTMWTSNDALNAFKRRITALSDPAPAEIVFGHGEGGVVLATDAILRPPNLVTGAGDDAVAGADFYIKGALGRGTGDVGQIIFQTAQQAAADTVQTYEAILTLDEDSATFAKTLDAPAYKVNTNAGIDESGGGTITTFSITIEKGIVTAFSKLS